MILTAENYYSSEANKEYMSVSQFKDFVGTWGKRACEFTALKKMNGEWEEPKSTALLVGSYVDSYFEGSLDTFKEENPDIFTQKGELKAPYKQAEKIIERIERDDYFMQYLAGEKQVIMTGELFGAKWKIKMDSYLFDRAIVDLKVMRTITEAKWVKDIGYLDFVRYWGYDVQGAVYQEIVRQNTGDTLPFYIAAATKENEADLRIIHVHNRYLKEALDFVEANMPRVLRVKEQGETPDRCELCDCCRATRVLTGPISIDDLLFDV
jgi:hypothetical protein